MKTLAQSWRQQLFEDNTDTLVAEQTHAQVSIKDVNKCNILHGIAEQ